VNGRAVGLIGCHIDRSGLEKANYRYGAKAKDAKCAQQNFFHGNFSQIVCRGIL